MIAKRVSVDRSILILLCWFAGVGLATFGAYFIRAAFGLSDPAPYQSKYKVADDALREFHRIRHLRGKE